MKGYWRILLIVGVMAAVFTPSIFGEFITADDTYMIDVLRAAESVDFRNLFFGSHTEGLYYRPLLMASFYVDKLFWSLHPFAMRFENVLLHLFSTLVIYAILKTVLRAEGRDNFWLPCVGALLFGLNPLVTESVNWVSGRTDLLAGFFLFLSALAIVKYRAGGSWLLLVAAAFAGLCGMLSKEVAIAFAPGAMLLLSAGDMNWRRYFSVWLRPLVLLAMAGGALGLFIYLRSYAVSSDSSKIGTTLQFILNDPFYDCLIAFRLLGFYLQKIFFPWPQSFVILEVDPVYELLGMVLSVVCVRALFSRKYAASFFMTGVLLLAPTFPLVFNQISWTPYAERYAYVASGFVVTAAVLFTRDRVVSQDLWRYATFMVLPLLLVLSVSTWQRNRVWQTNETLWWDTVEKSPNFAPALSEYGLVLLNSGELDRAASYFKQAASAYRLYYNDTYDCNHAKALEMSGDFFAAERVYQKALAKTNNRSALARQGLIFLYEKELRRNRPRIEKNELHNRLESCRSMSAELESDSTLSAPRGPEYYLSEGDGGLPETK